MSDIDKLREEKKNSNKEIFESVKNYAAFFTAVSVIAIGIYKIITYYFNFIYALEAEKFYNVPKEYFFENIVDDNFIILFLGIVFIIMIISPFLLKELNNKKRLGILESIGYSLLLVLVTFFISLIFCYQILINRCEIKGYDNLMFFVVIVLNVITFLLFMYTLVTDFSDKSIMKKKLIKEHLKCIRNNIKNSINNIKNIKTKINKMNIFISFWTVLIVFYSLVIISLASIKINIMPENKKDYEVIIIENVDNFVSNKDESNKDERNKDESNKDESNNNERNNNERNDDKEKVKFERAVILSKKNGLFLVMNIDEEKYKKNIFKLTKDEYKFISPNGHIIEKKTFDIIEYPN